MTGLGSLAGAAPSETEQKLESARDEAQLITQRINSKSAEIAELEQRAADAAAREQELLAELRESTARSTALNDDLLAAEKELEAVRGTLQAHRRHPRRPPRRDLQGRRRRTTSASSSSPRATTTCRRAPTTWRRSPTPTSGSPSGSTACATRSPPATSAIADLKESIDEEARRLEAARKEIESVRAAAQARAAEVADARAAEQAALGELQERISGWELEIRQEAAEELGDGRLPGRPLLDPHLHRHVRVRRQLPRLNPSSGAGGAYQIIPSTWHAYGGQGLAAPGLEGRAGPDRRCDLGRRRRQRLVLRLTFTGGRPG